MITEEMRIRNLQPPQGHFDAVLDTDAYNEIDDQFALSYLLSATDCATVKALCAAPFLNSRSVSPEDGMVRSEAEIRKLLTLAGRDDLQSIVYAGSRTYLPDEHTPVDSPAARAMAELSKAYSPEHPLYIVAIGAITNVASALLMDPTMADRVVIVWLGGHAQHWHDTREFNMMQDVAAARVVFGCGAPLVQLPCRGVVDRFTVSKPELEYWMIGKSPLCTYLAENTIQAAEAYASGRPWTRVIWDVTAVAWLFNKDGNLMDSRVVPAPIPEYDDHYGYDYTRHSMRYVTYIQRDALMADLFRRLGAMN